MKNKVFLVITILILIFIFHPIAFLWNTYSKHVLVDNAILSELGKTFHCQYLSGGIELTTRNPTLSCGTTEYFDEAHLMPELKKMANILESKNWRRSELQYTLGGVYEKDHLQIAIGDGEPLNRDPKSPDINKRNIGLGLELTAVGSWVQWF